MRRYGRGRMGSSSRGGDLCQQPGKQLIFPLLFTPFNPANQISGFFVSFRGTFRKVVPNPSFTLNSSCAAVKGICFLEERGSKAKPFVRPSSTNNSKHTNLNRPFPQKINSTSVRLRFHQSASFRMRPGLTAKWTRSTPALRSSRWNFYCL